MVERGNALIQERINAMTKTRDLIEEFLEVKRFAMVGVSRNPREFSRRLFEEFLRRGFDVIPVNPYVNEIDGVSCFKTIRDVRPHVTSALLMIPKAMTDKVLLECAESGVTLVWLYGISGPKDVSPNALEICAAHGIKVIRGYCPFMFLPATPFFHRMHGAAWKLFGKYPD
jgi:hypothetical protein